ncbi:MAG: ribonuclease P protein component [Chloroflexota bacterium]|nr:ribonuclease P protein component [Chloroflexota bacterium]HEV8054607.1 ribonuclease P protein component [Candidatus Limnocylindrales bacterium]
MVDAARLRHTKDITSVRANGLARSDKHLSIRARPNTIGVVRVAVSATRDLRTAVRRNRARRRLREAVRQELRSRVSAPGMDLVIAARRPALDASGAELRASVCRMLDAVTGS